MKGTQHHSKILGLILLSVFSFPFSALRGQEAMNRPYVDDKLFHFGFQVGMNFGAFGASDSNLPVAVSGTTGVLHARVSSVMPGFHVGFVSDLRLIKHVNLRFTPGLQFTSRTLTYKFENNHSIQGSRPEYGNTVDVLAIPIYLPLYLKFSADRQSNYRPYVIAGGGASFNVSRDNSKPVMLNVLDYFCEVGFGVDLYLRWFKLCPELTYRIGFANQLCPTDKRPKGLDPRDQFYTDAISRLTTHCVCLTFNFE